MYQCKMYFLRFIIHFSNEYKTLDYGTIYIKRILIMYALKLRISPALQIPQIHNNLPMNTVVTFQCILARVLKILKRDIAVNEYMICTFNVFVVLICLFVWFFFCFVNAALPQDELLGSSTCDTLSKELFASNNTASKTIF